MLGHIFDKENVAEDIYDRSSDHVMGGWSILTGIAANMSIESGNLVDIDSMLKAHQINLPRPL
jgi:hypothetical protein